MANNPALYNSVIAGAAGGTQQRWNTQTRPSDFENVADSAAALANAIDTLVSTLPETNISEIGLLQSIIQGIFADRLITSENSADYSAIAESAIALWTQMSTVMVPPILNPLGPVTVFDFLEAAGGNINTAINLALAYANTTEIIFPPYVYEINTAIVSNLAFRTLKFVPGAIIVINDGGSFTINGRGTTLEQPLFRFNEVVFGEALVIVGEDCIVNWPRFENNADNSDLTCIQIAGDGCTVNQISIYSEAKSLAFGIYLETLAATHVKYVTVNGIYADLGDPSVSDGNKSYDAIVYMHSAYSCIRDFTIGATGGRTLFPAGVIVVEGQKNVIENFYMFPSYGATYGIFLKTNSEFLEILGSVITGRNNGTYQANSVGIHCDGNFAGGHLKMFNTAITGFNVGMQFMGGMDTPTFVGVSIANNNTYGMVIDTAAAGGLVISAWTMIGCYLGDVTQQRDIHFKSGSVIGMSFTSCQIGISDGQVGFYVEPTFTQLGGVVFTSCRFLGASGGSSEYVFEPNINTDTILFISNGEHSIAALGTGTYASKCMKILDPVLTGLVIGTRDPAGTSNNHMTRFFTDIYTANFGNIAAGATVSLTFNFPGVPTSTTAQLVATMGGALGAFAVLGIDFDWYIHSTGFLGGTARNSTGSTINSVSGGIRFGITVFG
jgi:hypothetical protein